MASLEFLPSLSETVRLHKLRAEKSLGQNFLLDQNITDKIIRSAPDLSGINAIEIGPGPGGLTRSLVQSGAAHVTAIEFDPRAVVALQDLVLASGEKLSVMQRDALKTDLTQITSAPRAIIANLPYNISTVLLINWLRQIYEHRDNFQFMLLMFQKEVADRLTASPGTGAYGRLSVMAQWLCQVQEVLQLPPSVFTPPPKINSSVVLFRPRERSGEQPAFEKMEKILAAAFQQRRKMIRSSLKNYTDQFSALDIDPTARAENLTVNDYRRLALI